MFEVIQQNEATAVRRRLYFKIFDSTDAVSGKVITVTGVKMRLSKNGAASAASTADIVAVDPTNEPGKHYIELTAAEADTIGQIVAELPAGAGYLAASAQASIVAYDPYADGASVTTIAAGVRTELTTELADVASIATGGSTLTAPERAAIADAIAARNYRGGSNTSPTNAEVAASGLLDFVISGTTLTVKHSDGTTAFTRTLTRDQTLQIGAILSAA
jgi:hypothetical protein